MKKIVIIVGIILVVGIGGYFVYNSFTNSTSTQSSQVTVKAYIGDIEDSVTATGSIEPKTSVDIGAQVSGQVMDILVEVGDSVKEGDLLAKIDATVYTAKVDALKAQVKAQKYQLDERKAQADMAELTLKRQQNLYEQNATSLESLQNAQLSHKSSLASYNVLKAQIEQNESTLRAESANLQYTNIFAPISGTIVDIKAKKGQTLNATQQSPTILTIADLSTMTVRAQVSESDVTNIKKGMSVYFKTLGSQKKWYSKLDKIEPTPTITNNIVLYNALFDIENKEANLMTSMTAQVFFEKASAKNAIIVPLSAVNFIQANNQREQRQPREQKEQQEGSDTKQQRGERGERSQTQSAQKKAMIKVITDGEKVEEREVVIGVTNRIHAQVVSGLSENEVVLTSNVRTNNQRAQQQQNTQNTQNNALGQTNQRIR